MFARIISGCEISLVLFYNLQIFYYYEIHDFSDQGEERKKGRKKKLKHHSHPWYAPLTQPSPLGCIQFILSGPIRPCWFPASLSQNMFMFIVPASPGTPCEPPRSSDYPLTPQCLQECITSPGFLLTEHILCAGHCSRHRVGSQWHA